MKILKLFFYSLLTFSSLNIIAQADCANMAPFCANGTSGTTYPASTNNSSETGPNYGCLATHPNPAWYYFQVSQSGSIDMGISGTGGGDVDFICWGPFSSPNGNCGSALTSGNTIDCSYSASPTETCTISNATAGEYYVLLLTNYSNQVQNINFNQVGGSGSTNCNLIAPVTSATVCSGNAATISVSTNLQNPTFLWSPGGQTTQTISVSPGTTTVYTVTVNGLNAANTPTSTTNTGTVTVNALPVVSIPSTLTMCQNSSTSVTSSVSPSGTYNYSWSTGATTSNISVNTTTVVSLTATNTVDGCVSNVATCSVTVLPSPTVTTNPLYNICGGSTVVITPTVTGGTPAYNYSWTPSSLGTVTTVSISTSGVFDLLVTDQNSCTGTVQFTVSTTQPTLSISASPNSICANATSTLSSSYIGADTYSWSSGSISDTAIVSSAGTYSLLITVNGCTASATTSITVNPTPTVTIPGTAGMCAGANATVSVTSFSPAGVYTYTWSNGSNSNSAIVSTATVLTVQITNISSGCTSAISNTCNVIPVSNPTITMSGTPVVFCSGSNAVLTPTIISGGSTSYTYAWFPSSLGTSSIASTPNQGVYSLTVTDGNSCSASGTVSTVLSIPTVTLSSPDLVLCPNECTIIYATGVTSYSPATYSWSNSTSFNSDSTEVCSSGPVQVTFTDAKGCIATNTITVVNDIIPTVSFISNPPSPVNAGQIINFTNTSTVSTGSITSATWSFGDGDTAIGNQVNHTYSNVGSFPVVLTVTGSSGCTNTVSVVYQVDAVLEIPNVFTPNGDGVNDLLKFRYLEVFNSNNLTIFNRWGKKVFEQDNYKNDWNGGGLNDGTYFFILSVPEASPNIYKGYIQLIR
ncbi:MAG TPA: gliding motility-associated C-terminal domain-containing protein [Bacteroidia bacterium]|nr:gliding motility-associated C-terminal domain-containing protein [Bacteroidia bacterium]